VSYSQTFEEFSIVEGYERTEAYLDPLRNAADAYRNALGFFAKSVYEEFARGGSLYVLAKKTSGRLSYAGHLLFSCRYPRAHVLQIFVLPEHRRHGKAGDLLRHLENSLTQQGFISIYARVAEDLAEANTFWEGKQFYVQRVEQGGASRNRKILVRSHELPSPQLFPASGISSTNPLGLSVPTSNDVPLFLLDLNVLFDVMPRRLRHEDAAALFQAERVTACRLAVSNEIREELKRTAHGGRTDPMEAYISIFPSFPLVHGAESEALLRELAALVFPEERVLGDSDKSDLRHLATAIQHDLAGFITSDDAILTASSLIQTKYGLQVVSPAAFRMDSSPAVAGASFDVSSDSTLRLAPVTADEEPVVRVLLSKAGLSGSAIASVWCPAEAQVASRMAIWKGSTALGYLTWMNRFPGSETAVARIMVDETDLQALAAGRILLTHLLEQLASSGPRHIGLELPGHQSLLRELALGLGFRGAPGQAQLTKLALGRVFTRTTWDAYRKELSTKGGPRLPDTVPDYRSIDQQITVFTPDGNQAHVSLDLLETLLSPALLCLPGRPAIITPIQRRFSEALLGHSRQTPLLPRGNASTYQDRHYLASPRSLSCFKRGALMFFYESGKQGTLVALARVRQAYLRPEDASSADLRQSVLTEANLADIGKSETKTVAVFDNIFHLPRGVPLSSLQRIGCGRPNDLITTRPITDTQLQEILVEAFQHG
jgi:ribosomal protein S18 acetylase RimI-like enzyme